MLDCNIVTYERKVNQYNYSLFIIIYKDTKTIRIKLHELRIKQSDGRSSGDGVNSGADLQLTVFPRSRSSLG